MSFQEILDSEIQNRNLEVSPTAQKQLTVYAHEIEHWTRTVNLTALRGADLVRRLIVEPVWIGIHLQMSGVLADVGSGNGSPGIPLCTTRKFSKVHLLEPRLRRAAFLRHVVAKLGLGGISIARSRIEDVPVGTISADWITLQALNPSEVMLNALRGIASQTTRVVWITSRKVPPVESAEKFEIPNSVTKVWVFRLDQS